MEPPTFEHARLIAATVRAMPVDAYAQMFVAAKVRVGATGFAACPDVTIVCGPLAVDPVDPEAISNPTILVEVLSNDDEAHVRGEKWAHYRKIGSLRAYVLVDQRQPRIEMFERWNDAFRYHLSERGASLRVPGLDEPLHVDALYRALPPIRA